MFTGFLQLALTHTVLMHGWMNAWAELLGFADREFYQVLSYICIVKYAIIEEINFYS